MIRRIIVSLLVVVLAVNLTACNRENEKKRYEAEFLTLFDTVTKIVAYTDNKEEFSNYAKLIHDELEKYHQLYDIYHDYAGINNIKTINDNAGIAPVKVDKKILDLILLSQKADKMTGGKINIAFGSVLKIWHNYRTEGIDDPDHAKLPPFELLQEAAKHTNIDDVIINKQDSTVYLKDPKMSLDVGAIAKGYATEQVSQYIEKKGFTSGLISVGGNVRAIGTKGSDGGLWNVGIQNPDKSSKQSNIFIANLSDLSLVTSGVYERYYTVNGKNYHHIIDPNTLYPSQYFASVTIICKDSGLADALSTSVFNMPFEEGLKLIESLPNTDALWIYENGDVKYSSHFMDMIKKNES